MQEVTSAKQMQTQLKAAFARKVEVEAAEHKPEVVVDAAAGVDRRMDLGEFTRACESLGFASLDVEGALKAFDTIDVDDTGYISFQQFQDFVLVEKVRVGVCVLVEKVRVGLSADGAQTRKS